MTDAGRQGRPGGWRERRRFLFATIVLTALYLAIQEAWLWGAVELGRRGWTYDDPARLYAEEAAALREQSKAREAALTPHHLHMVFELGLRYGYLSQWLGGYGAQPQEIMRELARPVQANLERLRTLAQSLGIGDIEPLPVRTAADFGQLTQRLEDDAGGVAQRVERATSPRLRHLFMVGVHAGTQLAALESARDVMPIPASALIGKHGTLAGLAQPLWRPLMRVGRGGPEQATAEYRSAIVSLDQALVPAGERGGR